MQVTYRKNGKIWKHTVYGNIGKQQETWENMGTHGKTIGNHAL